MEADAPVAYYREFAPCDALRPYVRAFFSCTRSPENGATGRRIFRNDRIPSFCPVAFADAHVSMVVAVGREHSQAIGPMIAARPASPRAPDEVVGVYLRAARASTFMRVPTSELTERVATLAELWGSLGRDSVRRISAAGNEISRIYLLENALLQQLAGTERANTSVNVEGLAALVVHRQGRITVRSLADAAGVSRQRLTKLFHEKLGVSPKQFGRLARFRASLARCSADADWAQLAIELGYADQSHMIAEFREFSGLTPGELARRTFFHPFLQG
jgi:AraC-like DNA-binding protein